MAGGGSGDGEFGLQIAPMLDILFVLLLFFMVSAGAQKHEASISTQLPGSGSPPGGAVPVRINIDANGQINVNGAASDGPTDQDLLQTRNRLKSLITSDPKQAVIITPTRSTRHQRVVDVLNTCSAAGVKNLAFGTPED